MASSKAKCKSSDTTQCSSVGVVGKSLPGHCDCFYAGGLGLDMSMVQEASTSDDQHAAEQQHQQQSRHDAHNSNLNK